MDVFAARKVEELRNEFSRIFSSMMTYHAQFLLLVVAGWVNRQQQDVIDYLCKRRTASCAKTRPF